MKHYHIRKGYNIPIAGEASKVLQKAESSAYFSLRPTEFPYVRPKLLVAINDTVKIGTPLFFDKRQPDVIFVSPAAGKVCEIALGPRRVIERITIEASDSQDAEQFSSFIKGEIRSLDRGQLVELLLKGGMWPFLRQRPFDVIANPQQRPDAIFINGMDTAPLAADTEFTLKRHLSEFRAGLEAMQVLASQLHITFPILPTGSIFQEIAEGRGLSLHCFSGPHPTGLVSTHIYHISPLHANKLVWYLNARDLVHIGSFLLTGQFPIERTVALAGVGLKERTYVKMKASANVTQLLKHRLVEGEQRIISGNVLTGKKISDKDSIGFYDNLLTVIPLGSESHFLGWMRPGWDRPSWSRAFMSSLLRKRRFPMSANRNGEERAFVKTGDYEKVMALDVLPSFLIKAILIEDIDLMEQLGIYEIAPEDVALCSYMCPSKIEFNQIVRSGLDLMLAEMN